MAAGVETLTIRRRKELALDAAQQALRLRSEMGLGLQAPAPVFDIIDKLGVELRFWPIPSLEGVYRAQPSPVILISSDRPPGRQVYTGAHELGHHVYGHGVAVDEASENAAQEGSASTNPEEYLADRFAGFFLMPATTVKTRLPDARLGVSGVHAAPSVHGRELARGRLRHPGASHARQPRYADLPAIRSTPKGGPEGYSCRDFGEGCAGEPLRSGREVDRSCCGHAGR